MTFEALTGHDEAIAGGRVDPHRLSKHDRILELLFLQAQSRLDFVLAAVAQSHRSGLGLEIAQRRQGADEIRQRRRGAAALERPRGRVDTRCDRGKSRRERRRRTLTGVARQPGERYVDSFEERRFR